MSEHFILIQSKKHIPIFCLLTSIAPVLNAGLSMKKEGILAANVTHSQASSRNSLFYPQSFLLKRKDSAVHTLVFLIDM